MDIKKLSSPLIRKMHEGIREALSEDDATPIGVAKRYLAREEPDWRTTSQFFESELSDRGDDFEPIDWSPPPTRAVRVFLYGKGGSPIVGEVYVIQHSHQGQYFVERLRENAVPIRLGGPFPDPQDAKKEAARHS